MNCSSRLITIYSGMKYRCYNPKSINYKNYGERGITVCKEWLDNKRINVSWHNNPTKGFIAFKE